MPVSSALSNAWLVGLIRSYGSLGVEIGMSLKSCMKKHILEVSSDAGNLLEEVVQNMLNFVRGIEMLQVFFFTH